MSIYTTFKDALDAGYKLLSGFGYIHKKIMQKSLSQSTNSKVILINRLTTPLGPMFVCATSKSICLLEFVDRHMLETKLKNLKNTLWKIIYI